MGFNYAMPALRYLVLVASPTFCGCAAPVYDKTPTAMCKPQQRASWRGAKLSYIALQFTLMKWPQQKADLSSPFFFLLFWCEARTVGTDIYLLLYLQHVNQRHLIPEKAYNYTLDPAVMFSWSCHLPVISKTRMSHKFLKLGSCPADVSAKKERKKGSMTTDKAHQTAGNEGMRHQRRPVTRNKL